MIIFMKQEQFEQQVGILSSHNEQITKKLHTLHSSQTPQNPLPYKKTLKQLHTLTHNLYIYCHKLLYTCHKQTQKTEALRQKLMRALDKNRHAVGEIDMYRQLLGEAEDKIGELFFRNQELELINRNLSAQLKLTTAVSSFTFKDQHTPPHPKINKLESSVQSGCGTHEASSCSAVSELDDVELYQSILEELNANVQKLESIQIKNSFQPSQILEEEEKIDSAAIPDLIEETLTPFEPKTDKTPQTPNII